jgi:UDP-2,3-diacylglucosamine pyrophosphatase LpxH
VSPDLGMRDRFASMKTTKEDSTLCSLYGRMLLMLFNDALCPQIRAALWEKPPRELSVLKLVWHCQAFAERWMQAILQSKFALRRLRQQVCTTAERLVVKASRKRCTTAQILRDSLQKQGAAVVFLEAVNA